MNRLPKKYLSLIILWIIAPACFALSSDAKLPYHFKSNSITYLEKRHQTIYTGHVHVTQGTTQLSSKRLLVQYRKGGGIEKMIATGNLAHYSTLPDHQPARLFAEAKKITFNPIAGTVLLEHKARVTQEKNIFTGPHIWYDVVAGVVRTTPQKHQKTVIVIQAQDQQ